MKAFNPEKELRKIQHGNRNKILYGIIALLLIIAIGSSYALYQVRYSKRIIYTKVAPFSNHDINLAVYIDGTPSNNGDFPEKNEGKIYEKIDCGDTKVKAYWDYDKWALVLETSKKAKCSVYFKTGTDKSGANPPELYQGLIPVKYDEDGTIRVADPEGTDWYNYDEKKWANAVLVTSEKYKTLVDENTGKLKDTASGTVLNLTSGPEDTTYANGDILQMYVWIPRYKYQLFNINNSGIAAQPVNIKFEHETETTGEVSCKIDERGVETCKNAINGNWYTHPAFTFGNTELTGIWVGKFEPSEKSKTTTGTINQENASITNITILPNKVSIVNRNISIMFQATRDIETNEIYNLNSKEIDTHMMKNIEWGAVAYLSQSIYGIFSKDTNGNISCSLDSASTAQNCRIWNNPTTRESGWDWDGTITGCSGTSAEASELTRSSSCSSGRTWDEEGKKASTTGNLHGIYDMVDGMWECVMGNMTDSNGNFYSRSGGFVEIPTDETQVGYPDLKYYDVYEYSTSDITHNRGHLGDATRETMAVFGDTKGGWNGDYGRWPYNVAPWFERGGLTHWDSATKLCGGIFATMLTEGTTTDEASFRVVLTAQDGNS